MKFLDHFDHTEKKQNKEHFLHLIQIASADGIIGDSELKMLNRIGTNLGLTDAEIKDLFDSSKNSAYIPPYEFSKRFGELYRIVQMILADNEVAKEEIHLANIFGMKSGFSDEEMKILLPLLIDGIRGGEDEEDLFSLFKKKRNT